MPRHHPTHIVSGGQTGVDRAALDAALTIGIPVGGWCPKDRLAEDGPLDQRYPLRETPQSGPAQRTEWNVRDSDGTLILASAPLRGGTKLTHKIAERLGRPVMVVDPGDEQAVGQIQAWLTVNAIGTVNIAGPRESEQPGIYDLAARLLSSVLS